MITDPTVIAAAIVTVIAALVAGVVTVLNAVSAAGDRKDARASREVTKEVNHKADTIIEKAIEIHTLTNSNLSKVTEALNVATEKIIGLENMVAALTRAKDIADSVAETVARRTEVVNTKHPKGEQP